MLLHSIWGARARIPDSRVPYGKSRWLTSQTIGSPASVTFDEIFSDTRHLISDPPGTRFCALSAVARVRKRRAVILKRLFVLTFQSETS